jgi:hypothetical protein
MNDGGSPRRIPWLYLVCVPVAILGALFSSRLVGRGWNWEAAISNGVIIGVAAILGQRARRRKFPRNGPANPQGS